MSASENVMLILRGFPADLREKVDADVAEKGTNRNDVVVGILARDLGVPFEPTGRSSSGGASRDWTIRLPKRLKEKIERAAFQKRMPQSQVVYATLAAHYGVRVPARPRPGPARRPAVAT